jgi:hypothetical protein
MRSKVSAIALLVFAFALAGHAADCNFNVKVDNLSVDDPTRPAVTSGQSYALTWSPIVGATQYRIVESTTGFASPVQASNVSTANVPGIRFPSADNPLRLSTRHFASDDLYYGYTITAYAPDDSAVCATTLALQIHPDDATREFFHRVVVPVAGSVTAADGSKFHTSLRLFITGAGSTASGRVFFHPQGTFGDNDPSIPYSLEALPDISRQGATQYWDDVVAAMGASGIGSLDVIPDSGHAPEIEARVWNDIHGLINSATVPPFKASDLFHLGSGSTYHFSVWTDEGKSRMNIGFRTYGKSAATVHVTSHLVSNYQFVIPPNSFRQIPLAQLVNGAPTEDGQQVDLIVSYPQGSFDSAAFVYYTITDNTTNDPRVFVPNKTSDVSIDLSTPVSY